MSRLLGSNYNRQLKNKYLMNHSFSQDYNIWFLNFYLLLLWFWIWFRDNFLSQQYIEQNNIFLSGVKDPDRFICLFIGFIGFINYESFMIFYYNFYFYLQ